MEKAKEEEQLLKSPEKPKHNEQISDQVTEASEFEVKGDTSPLREKPVEEKEKSDAS